MPELYEMYSTNGDSALCGGIFYSVEGAYYDVGSNICCPYDKPQYRRILQPFPGKNQLTADGWFQDDKYIYIPASAFGSVLYRMFKIDSKKMMPCTRIQWTEMHGRSLGVISRLKAEL